jgi:hypothetical protein
VKIYKGFFSDKIGAKIGTNYKTFEEFDRKNILTLFFYVPIFAESW